ncbi:YjiH family protein [Vibrio viridaestus]|nr:YjiH family protein [Vibrio viridaestus]
MMPLTYNGDTTIPVAVLAAMMRSLIGQNITIIVANTIIFMALISLAYSLYQPKFLRNVTFIHQLLSPSPTWIFVRLIGGFCAFCISQKVGPQWIWDANTGGLVLNDLLPTLFSVFTFAGLLLPFLLNFGLLEFFGTLLGKVMRPLFNLPGRSAIDCMTSWLGDGSVGILLTSKQFEEKFYTQREAAVVGTTFSAVSITFTLIVLAQVKLESLFVPFYFTICFAGLVAAVILPRIPPLSLKHDLYIDGSTPQEEHHHIPQGHSYFSWGFKLAINKAESVKSLRNILFEGVRNSLDMVLGVLPVVMALGTIALVLAEHTAAFSILGQPFIPFLEWLGVPHAVEASKTVMVGFADMFIPAIVISSVDSDITKFIIAAMSVTQLIYMSEVGALLLGCKIPINIFELFIIFILRTLITMPIICIAANFIF